MKKRKICVITGTRAEFGMLQWLLEEIKQDNDLELQIIATGMHLSPEFGLTYKLIEEKGFKLNKKIETLLSSDSTIGISKSIGLGIISFSEAYIDLRPDIIVVLGDRFEILSAVVAAVIARIPIGHIHGGETTEGLIDEAIRHSITKMSHLHFTATEIYSNRVIQLGESPDRVFNTGAPGLDNIEKLELLTRNELEEALNFKLGLKNILITYHPVTLENQTSEVHFMEILSALDEYPDAHLIFTMPNSDTDGRVIINLINEYVKNKSMRACAFISLGQIRYLSLLKYVDVILGNSSSGLIEAPSFHVPTVNIGDRQKGRIRAPSVIDCSPKKQSIMMALERAFSKSFISSIRTVENPYGPKGASKKIKEILKSFPLEGILEKEFYDL